LKRFKSDSQDIKIKNSSISTSAKQVHLKKKINFVCQNKFAKRKSIINE